MLPLPKQMYTHGNKQVTGLFQAQILGGWIFSLISTFPHVYPIFRENESIYRIPIFCFSI